MAIYIENENFGYAVTAWDDHAVVGNPDLLLYSEHTASYHTGSVLVYKHNVNQDAHDLIATLHAQSMPNDLILAAEISGSFTGSLRTEQNGVIRLTDFRDLLIDEGAYLTHEDDAYGHAVDLWDDTLVVGCKYFHQYLNIGGVVTSSTSGSYVDVYNLDKLDPPAYTNDTYVTRTGWNEDGSYLYETASIPVGYDVIYVLYDATGSTPYSQWSVTDVIYPPTNGGLVYYSWPLSVQTGSLAYRCTYDREPLTATIFNPDPQVTHSFGHKVAINEEWMAVSSIEYSNAKGAVYMYKKVSDPTYTTSSKNYVSWSLSQIITGSNCITNDRFGWDIDLNKQSGSYSGSLIVGTNRTSSSAAYLYRLVTTAGTSSWDQAYIFTPTTSSQYLTFYNSTPVYSGSTGNLSDGYGKSVAIWEGTYVVGAPTDRYVYEYSASSLYQQGAVYVYEDCPNTSSGYNLALKTYGNEKILKNNMLGFSVDAYKDKIVAGAPKKNNLTSCYIQGTIYDDAEFLDKESSVNGQMIYLRKNTSSLDWDLVNVYQTKKDYLQPHTKYGYDVAVHNQFIVVGAPMYLTDTNRFVDMAASASLGFGSISGKAYIYNFNNFQTKFYVGNVFYRNGLLVINTSGSVFENLFLDNKSSYEYQYTLDYKSKQTMYETQIVCSVESGEFNVSTNPTALTKSCVCFDMNGNGVFDFQDVDVLLKYMQYQNTKFSGTVTNNWSQSLSFDDGENSFFQWSNDQYTGTGTLFSSSFNWIDANLKTVLDINQDQKIDINDMYIMWKYFSNRLTQKNYEKYITPLSQRTLYSDVLDFLNSESGRGEPPQIRSDFLNYESNVSNDPTGSYLAPFVTTIGMYNGIDLVAVAKLGTPIKLVPDFPYTFVVKMDF